MKKIFAKFYPVVGAFVSLMLISTFSDATSNQNVTPKMKINVGIYAPFSNESAFIGRNMLGAMEIAREHLDSEINYEFYTLDKIPNKAQATRTLQKFIDTHHIQVLLTEGAGSGTLAAPLAKQNNLIHFCLTNKAAIADGRNNFLAQSPHYKQSTVLTQSMKPEFIAQYKAEYFSSPVSEAGYAFDIFHLLHNSITLAMKTHNNFSSQLIAQQLLALEPGIGVMGPFTLGKNGIFYKKQTFSA